MNKEEIVKRNNAIVAFMGGPSYLRETIKSLQIMSEDEFLLMGPEDLQYNTSWDWMIPVWAKVRFQMNMTMIVSAISFIDTNEIDQFYTLVSQVCINWCKTNNIKL